MRDHAVYGLTPPDLAAASAGAVQVSPLVPGAADLENLAAGALDGIVIVAPPGTLERRFVLAHALRSLAPGGELIALAPKHKGGARLRKELESFGCQVSETARRHQRLCSTHRPAEPAGLAEAIAKGTLQFVPGPQLWSQPGVFSWDHVDPGSALLLETLANAKPFSHGEKGGPAPEAWEDEGVDGPQANPSPSQPLRGRAPPSPSGRGVSRAKETGFDLAGAGADLGCGVGLLGKAVLGSPAVGALTLLDIDARAVAAARRNIADPRADFLHADARQAAGALAGLDFVITNPPFHDGGREDRSLGQAFIAAAGRMLRPGGVCWLVANVALPYEQPLIAHFSAVSLVVQARGYKVYEARK